MAVKSILIITVGDESFPFLSSLYKSWDPARTVGSREYFEGLIDAEIKTCIGTTEYSEDNTSIEASNAEFDDQVERINRVRKLEEERRAIAQYDKVKVVGPSILSISVWNKEHPFLTGMYDPNDPDHTVGDRDYFEDQINEAINDSEYDYPDPIERAKRLEMLNKELQAIKEYDRIIVYG